MDDARWERYAALGGFLFVILGLVGAFLPGAPPATDASTADITKFFNDHTTAIEIAQFIGGLSVIALAWWFGSLFRRMRAAEGGNPRLSIVAILGLAFGGTMVLISGAILSAAAMRIGEIGDGSHVLFTMASVILATSPFGVIAFLSAVCALNLRTEMFPKWTSWLGYVAAVLFLVGSIGSATDGAAVNTMGLIGFLVWSVWIVVLSTMMWREAATTS